MTEMDFVLKIADELKLRTWQVTEVIALFADGSTVPFIARYRKEKTGNLDEVQIIAIRDRLEQLRELEKRRDAIFKSLEEQEKLTPELAKAVKEAETLTALEDIYLPYRPKRKTRGMKAIEKGLEPLAKTLFEHQDLSDAAAEASAYIDPEKEVVTAEDALAGARDIIAEWINEDAETRRKMRDFFQSRAQLGSRVVKAKEAEKDAAKYRDYFEWDENAADAPSHRILAIRRGADEGYLVYHILPEEEEALILLERDHVKGLGDGAAQVKRACRDCYRRLLSLSMETEMRSDLKGRADEVAITTFAENLRELLLASPLGGKNLLALDPGLRTGSKLVVLDRQGALKYHDVVYPLAPHFKTVQTEALINRLVERYDIEAVAIGNGTGGREATAFCKGLDVLKDKIVMMVNESGASVYSASEVARQEFPDHDLTVRGAVSIGRRLMDPLAELVKIDPKSIGVGQYQHDVDQKALKKQLDDVVVSCVNAVGVEVNTASAQLLSYVSGLSARLARALVDLRTIKGGFKSRKEIRDVPGMGPKTFQQAAGFLRIRDAENPLDRSAVHPESYDVVQSMADDLNVSVEDLIRDKSLREKIDLKKYITDEIGMPTLEDIMAELARPGRDPRKEFEIFSFTDGVNEVKDLMPGMKLPGVVTNVTAFGAFVDVGVHQDGLVHISQLADRFVDDPHQVVKVNQKVLVTVLDVDMDRSRVALSMKTDPDPVSDRAGAHSGDVQGTVRKVRVKTVKAVKKRPGGTGGQNRTGGRPGSRPGNRSSNESDAVKSGEFYNPFAALLKD